MAVIVSVPSAVSPITADSVPGDGTTFQYTKTGAGVMGRSASGVKVPQQPFIRIRKLGAQYDTAVVFRTHQVRATTTAHQTRGLLTAHTLRATFQRHTLRGED